MSHQQHREICKVTKLARVHLKYLCEKALQKNNVSMDQLAEQRETENLIQLVESKQHKPLEDFLMAFINRNENPALTQFISHFLLLLAGDAAIFTTVPFTYHYHILQTCAAIKNNVDIEKKSMK